MMTRHDDAIDQRMVSHRLGSLVNQFFKILPMTENHEPTLKAYMNSLQREMIGYHDLIIELGKDDMYLALLAILEYLIQNECDVAVVKCEVFKAISLLKKLQEKYAKEGCC